MSQRAGFASSLRRELQRLLERPWDLAVFSWLPLLLALLIWWIFSAGLPRGLAVGVLDQDHSALSRQLTRMLQATPGLQVREQYASERQMAIALGHNAVQAVVQLPSGLEQAIKTGHPAHVVLLHNAQLGTHSGLIQRDVRSAVATVSAGIELQARSKRGQPRQQAETSFEPLRTALLSLFNPSSDYERFLTLALIPALLHIAAMASGAWLVGSELRERSLGDWLGAAPSARASLAALLGKLILPWLGLSLIGGVLLLWLAGGSRGWQAAGSLPWTVLALCSFMGLSLLMGVLAVALSGSLRLALSATGFITAPAFAFAGMGFPLLAMPPLARAWALSLPYTHYVRLQTEQLHMGAPLAHSLPTPLWQLGATVLLLGLSAWLLARLARQPERWGQR